ncbi:hypothetical protein NMG29_39575 [Streptomyces cocklensis]|uniref:Uncharacterized protein n=1 Tax=Actinacidiphila cocklensis TaxID=887465 RepID=A0A9W4E2N0_9ACTN|nr:hypothetical protein [Actinacidiphila cocklensis]MDD1064175.1 hypothetical protein [Actinacidiphila cocklensis]CAG6398317.1 conserved hypothetical protein [Actinacidiphila cocklensis]
MDSSTLLGLAGIGGTVVAAGIGMSGGLLQASITRRGTAAAEDHKARRQVYGACATVLLARRDAVAELRELFRADVLDQSAAEQLLAEIESLRQDAARAIGAVMVEGPKAVGDAAGHAGLNSERAARRYRGWAADIAGGRDLGDLRTSTLDTATQDWQYMNWAVGSFLDECRKVLHPTEQE